MRGSLGSLRDEVKLSDDEVCVHYCVKVCMHTSQYALPQRSQLSTSYLQAARLGKVNQL